MRALSILWPCVLPELLWRTTSLRTVRNGKENKKVDKSHL